MMIFPPVPIPQDGNDLMTSQSVPICHYTRAIPAQIAAAVPQNAMSWRSGMASSKVMGVNFHTGKSMWGVSGGFPNFFGGGVLEQRSSS